jgi:dipeptidase E
MLRNITSNPISKSKPNFAMIKPMKRLFLASSGLEYIKTFIGKKPSDVRMLFIPTAGNLDEDVWWIDKDRDVLREMGFSITELDIENTDIDTMRRLINNADIVYVAGGNTFHLLKQLRHSGFDKILVDFINNGGLYAGASAGALIAGIDIAPIATIDEPEKVNELKSTQGLKLIDIIPIPHYDMKERTQPIDDIVNRYQSTYNLVTITDDQAIVVEGSDWRIVDSPRNKLELAWFKKSHPVTG